ncbi:MAG: hypothetical protein H7138_02285, partial [Myxococcales bacterium]|nr:hypothetical protein [Myxococcales bacterium]
MRGLLASLGLLCGCGPRPQPSWVEQDVHGDRHATVSSATETDGADDPAASRGSFSGDPTRLDAAQIDATDEATLRAAIDALGA